MRDQRLINTLILMIQLGMAYVFDGAGSTNVLFTCWMLTLITFLQHIGRVTRVTIDHGFLIRQFHS